jgi:TolB-like protein/class 3 adenylate cyclase
MSVEIKKGIQLEIAHVLFMDIVGYSTLLINEQRALLDTLNQIVRGTDEFRTAEAAGRLIKIPTGDGMALVFYNSPEEPVECALDISRALKTHPNLPLRMGAHSGPVSGVIDVNERANVAGAGINMAQRVMDCGDAGHILLSKRVAEDLEQYGHWQPHLHDLGECEVKHGVRVHIVNLFTDELGNPERPEKFKHLRGRKKMGAAVSGPSARPSQFKWVMIGAVVVSAVALAVLILMSTHRLSPKSVGAVTAPPPSSATPTVSEKSIAVLPFESLSRDPDNAYFATGIQDEILTRLAKIAALKVISRTSTQQYATRPGNLSEIARQLGVANILEGSVQKAADNVHINAQLIRAATDEHLWAESYDRKLENIFGVEAEVASAVAEALKAKLTGAEQQALEQKPTNNPEAYDAYLRGIALYREVNLVARLESIKPLEEAVRLDPNFAAAWALLTRVNSLAYDNPDQTPRRRAAAERSLDMALKLKPDLAEVQLAQAFYQYWVLRDYDAARRSFERLRAKLPNTADIPEALGLITRRQGRWEESRALTDEAIALNPRDRLLRVQAAWMRETTRDFPAALRSYDEALNIWPDDANLIAGKAGVYQALGELDQADALLERLHPTVGSDTGLGTICYQAELRRRYSGAINLVQTLLDQAGSLPTATLIQQEKLTGYRWDLADLQRLSGDAAKANIGYIQVRDEFEQLQKEQLDEWGGFSLALADVYALLGDRERALAFADRAVKLTPLSKDTFFARFYEETRASIAIRFGDKDLAIPALERLLKMPGGSPPLTPALLRLDPEYDSLRDDPRFQKLVTEAGPKP